MAIQRLILPVGLLALLLTVDVAQASVKDARATAVVGQFLTAYQHSNRFSAKMDVVTCEGTGQSRMQVEMTYAKPRNVALTVLEAPQFPAARGTTLTWLGESKARVSTHFYGLPLAITLPVDDPRICNLRGYSIAQVDIGNIVPILLDPSTQIHSLGSNKPLGGRNADGIDVRSPRLLRGIEREAIWLDAQTHFPLVREMYERGRVVYRLAFSSYAFNPVVPTSLFAKF
jgi:hypothetical protein